MSKCVNVEVTLEQAGGNVSRLIKRFIKKVKKERIIEDYLEKSRYVKPSEKRRRKLLRRFRTVVFHSHEENPLPGCKHVRNRSANPDCPAYRDPLRRTSCNQRWSYCWRVSRSGSISRATLRPTSEILRVKRGVIERPCSSGSGVRNY